MKKRIIANLSGRLDTINSFATRHSVLTACFFSIIVSSICLLQSGYYEIDNHIISLIMNQQFSSENYCIFVNYFFCVLVKAINSLIPTADGYFLICHSLLYIADAWIAYIIITNTKSLRLRIILLMTIIITLMGYATSVDISNSNFTIQTAGIFSVGAISVFAGIHAKKTTPYLIMAILFFTFGAMLRMAACLLTLPFICLHLFIDFMCSDNKVAFVRKALALIVVPMIIVVGIYNVNTEVRRSEKYAPVYSFNSARSGVIDFPMKDWDEVKHKFDGVSENDYVSLKRHLYGDTDRIDIEYFKNISYIGAKEATLSPLQIVNIVFKVIKAILHIQIPNLIFIFFFALFMLFSNIRLWRKLEIIFCALGILIISLWLSYNGRFFIRICAPMVIMFVITLATILLFEPLKLNTKKMNKSYRSLSVWSVIFAVILFGNSIIHANGISFALFAKAGADESIFEQHWQGDNLYVWDTHTFDIVIFPHYAKQGKMTTQRCLKHNVVQGEYTYGQVFIDEYFDKIGTNNPVRALINRPNTYYVSPNITFMETYLQENVNPTAQATQIGEIYDIPIWKFIIE